MFIVEVKKFSHIDQTKCTSITLEQHFKTKRAAIAYLGKCGFRAIGTKSPVYTGCMHNRALRANAYIYKA